MARTGHSATIGALARALEDLGMEALCARQIACDWAAHFPLVSRHGSQRIASSLEAMGLAPDRSVEAAGVMLALELQVKGAAYHETCACVERTGISSEVARAAAIDAARLWRSASMRNSSCRGGVVPTNILPIGVGAVALVLARLILFVS